jgi:hydrogenase small subunit
MNYINMAIDKIRQDNTKKLNCIWLETSSCFGEIIALLDGENPSIVSLLTDMVNMTFFNSIMADSGEAAYERLLNTVNSNEPYIFIVSGAIPLKDEGRYTIIANYKGKVITALEAVRSFAPKASYIIAAGTCTTYGGPTAARPNVSEAVPLDRIIDAPVINVPGCPVHPVWILGTIGHIINFGMPELDELNRPVTFFGVTIHERCPRRSFFDYNVFATSFGQPECMFKLGCRGPITKTTCPLNRWDESDSWPIGANTTCIGCSAPGFPDLMEPFIRY